MDTKDGLGSRQVTERLTHFGYNQLRGKKKTSLALRFLMQLNDFMIIVLLVAATVSLVVSIVEGQADFVDPAIILVIVVLNAVLGLVQESKAEKSLEALKQMSAPRAHVIRDGTTQEVDTKDLVPGDLILLKTGDAVPADARLVESANLKILESALTGESEPVEKDAGLVLPENTPMGDRRNMVYAGSSVSFGHGRAVVTDTGMHTEVGHIANMILTDEAPDTPLQKKLAQTGKLLGIGALIICGVIFVLGILRHIHPFSMFMTSVSLAVAAIPEGLPAIVTIMLAIGVQRMAKRNAVVRKLPAVETLGSATVICSDKTGTLTQNKMSVVEMYDSTGSLSQTDPVKSHILQLAALCNNAVLENGNVLGEPTEAALVQAAAHMGLEKPKLDRETVRIGEVPFDSKRKLMTTVHKTKKDAYISVTKGAPDFLLSQCQYYFENGEKIRLTTQKRKAIMAFNNQMGEKALRVLGIALREYDHKPVRMTAAYLEKELIFMGLVGMMDPPREEVRTAVATCKKAGIKPVMITGDHVITAMAIAKKIGLANPGDKAMTGEELSQAGQEELTAHIHEYSVFARVSPEHKVRIVKAFQAAGEVVAMTGDGVNDAPALKVADIGCAMGIAGTDVAKEASDMILTDDNFATIVHAVQEGRGIYANIRKAVHFLLSSNIGEILTILAAMLLGWERPLLAIHLLWVNLVTDSLPAIALGLDPAEANVMDRKPFKGDKSLFSGGLWQTIAFEGCMIGMLALLAFGIGTTYFDAPGSHAVGRTMAFATLSISQLVHAFNMRSEGSIFSISLFSNKYLIGAFFVGVAMQASVISLPFLNSIFQVVQLGGQPWLVVTILCLMPIMIVELEKLFSGKKPENHSPVGRSKHA